MELFVYLLRVTQITRKTLVWTICVKEALPSKLALVSSFPNQPGREWCNLVMGKMGIT